MLSFWLECLLLYVFGFLYFAVVGFAWLLVGCLFGYLLVLSCYVGASVIWLFRCVGGFAFLGFLFAFGLLYCLLAFECWVLRFMVVFFCFVFICYYFGVIDWWFAWVSSCWVFSLVGSWCLGLFYLVDLGILIISLRIEAGVLILFMVLVCCLDVIMLLRGSLTILSCVRLNLIRR